MIRNVINKLEHYWSMIDYFWLIFRNWGSQSSLNWLSGIDLFSHSMTFDPISGAPKCRPVEKRILRCLPSHPDTISTNNPIPPPPAPPAPPPPPAPPRFAPPPPRPSLIHSFIHSFYCHLCRLDSFTFLNLCETSMSSTSSHVAAYRALKILLFVERSRKERQCFAIDKKKSPRLRVQLFAVQFARLLAYLSFQIIDW